MNATLRLPAPGTKLGPCLVPCDHVDCHGVRQMAAVECMTCAEPIGFDRPTIQHGNWASLEHLSCAVERAEVIEAGAADWAARLRAFDAARANTVGPLSPTEYSERRALAAEAEAEADAARWDDDPNPYSGTYSEE